MYYTNELNKRFVLGYFNFILIQNRSMINLIEIIHVLFAMIADVYTT
jgi:hypothetical protein